MKLQFVFLGENPGRKEGGRWTVSHRYVSLLLFSVMKYSKESNSMESGLFGSGFQVPGYRCGKVTARGWREPVTLYPQSRAESSGLTHTCSASFPLDSHQGPQLSELMPPRTGRPFRHKPLTRIYFFPSLLF